MWSAIDSQLNISIRFNVSLEWREYRNVVIFYIKAVHFQRMNITILFSHLQITLSKWRKLNGRRPLPFQLFYAILSLSLSVNQAEKISRRFVFFSFRSNNGQTYHQNLRQNFILNLEEAASAFWLCYRLFSNKKK